MTACPAVRRVSAGVAAGRSRVSAITAQPPARRIEAGVDDSSNVPWPWRLYGGADRHLGLPDHRGLDRRDRRGGDVPARLRRRIRVRAWSSWSRPTPLRLRAQATEQRLFGSSLADSQALVVEHAQRQHPGGDPRQDRPPGAGGRRLAPQHRRRRINPDFALPLVNVPGSDLGDSGAGDHHGHLSLLSRRSAQSGDISGGAQRYAAAAPRPPGASVGVTGPVPAQISEGDLIENALVLLETRDRAGDRRPGRRDLPFTGCAAGAAGRCRRSPT